ncbi:MAG TPA: hypothetical protein VIK51_22380, partial [Vicinamibacteria bacterium]
MPTEVWRAGDYRVCPKCGARHKVQDLRCTQCDTVLAGTPVWHSGPARIAATAAGSGRGMRALLAVCLVVALGAGLWVRSLFRGAPIQDSVEASSATLAAAPAPPPTWTPPVLSYPPVVGYNQGVVPPSMAALTIQGGLPSSASAPEPTGMTSIAPPSEPTRKTAFTDADLLRMRGSQYAPPVATAVTSTATAPSGVVSSAVAVPMRATEVSEDKAREWIARVRDREDDVREAQAKVRRHETEVEARRAHAIAVASDVDAHDKAQRDVTDALEDLEKAERKLSEKQRDLDEAKVSA